MRIRMNASSTWSVNPSSQMKLGRKDVEYIDGCPLCNGEPQSSQEPSDGAKTTGASGSGNVRAGAQEKTQEDAVQEKERSSVRITTKVDDCPQAEGSQDDRAPKPTSDKATRKPGRLEREAERREAKYKEKKAEPCEAPADPKTQGSLMPHPDEDEKMGIVAYQHHQALVACRKMMGKALIEFSVHLREMRDRELWKVYGSESWAEYLAQPEISMDRTQADRLVKLVNVKDQLERQLGKKLDLEGIDEYKLTRGVVQCLEVDKETGEIKNIEVAEELIEKARTLGGNDWAQVVEENKVRGGGGAKSPPPELMIAPNTLLLDAEGNTIGVVVTSRANDVNHTLKIKIDNAYITDDIVIRIK